MSDSEKHEVHPGVPTLTSESAYAVGPGSVMGTGEPVPFTFNSLWGAVPNPLNHKSLTLPILNLQSAHARNCHLSRLALQVTTIPRLLATI